MGTNLCSWSKYVVVTPFDPPRPKAWYSQIRGSILYRTMVLSCLEPELLLIEDLHSGNGNFFWGGGRKIMENGKENSVCAAKLMQMMPKLILWSVIGCSGLYAIQITCSQSVVLRHIGGRGLVFCSNYINSLPYRTWVIRKIHWHDSSRSIQ